ncbi:hypothetical protein D3C78_1175400 [compost metagenome]
MRGQVFRDVRLAVRFPVFRRGDHVLRDVRQVARHHAAVRHHTDADADIVAVLDQVAEVVAHAEEHADLRVTAAEFFHQRQDEAAAEGIGQADAQVAGRLVAAGLELVDRGVQVVDRAAALRVEAATVLGQRQLARGAVEQPHLQFLFEPGNTLADRGRRHAQFAGGIGKAAILSSGHEDH